MNIDELIQAIRSISTEERLLDLAQYIEEWKNDDRNVHELEAMIEKFFGNSWLSTQEVHSKAYNLWNTFREDAIYKIEGMTMNERLYFFGLFERFDACRSKEEKYVVYSKLLANPNKLK